MIKKNVWDIFRKMSIRGLIRRACYTPSELQRDSSIVKAREESDQLS